jgi:hypothetical protein
LKFRNFELALLPVDGIRMQAAADDYFRLGMDITSKPLLTVLNFSAGVQSSRLLWGVIRKEIPVPENFIVLNADPGMENSLSYKYSAMMSDECGKVGIYYEKVHGGNLYKDLVNITISGKNRIDNPPYWVDRGNGKMGRLSQKCTAKYKIAPMDRAIRRVLHERFGISRDSKNMPEGCVEKWIGFSADEKHRIKESSQKYVRFRYPLIEMRETKSDVVSYLKINGIPVPPRSVCNACFANGIAMFKDMHDNRPEDWAQAVAVDNSIRDLTQVRIKYPAYVSSTLVPLEELARNGFKKPSREVQPDGETILIWDEDADGEEWSCDSGYCFT